MSTKRSAQSKDNIDPAPKRVKDDCENSEQPPKAPTTNSTPPISYNGMKNIMEHLSIEKRIESFADCPAVRSAERKADLHLDRLGFGNETFLINDLAFRVDVGRIHRINLNTETRFDNTKNDANTGRELTEMSREVLMEKLIHCHLGGRNTVKVRHLSFIGKESDVANLPEGVKFECEELRLLIDGPNTFPAIRRFLKDVPLKEFAINLDLDQHIPRDEIVLNAEYIEISKYSVQGHLIADDLIALKSRHIHIEQMEPGNLSMYDVASLALVWMSRDLPVGTQMTTTIESFWYTFELQQLLIQLNFGATQGKIHLEGLSEPLDCVTIPMASGH